MTRVNEVAQVEKGFDGTVDGLQAGERLSDETFRQNIVAAAKPSTFVLEERKTYFKKKWCREHLSLFAILIVILLAASVLLPIVFDEPALRGIGPLVALFEYVYQHNRMMVYVERHLYERNDDTL